MPIDNEEIVTEIEECIHKFGGGFGEWCVGTAKDTRGPFFRRHQQTDAGDGMAYREAYTTTAAKSVVAHLVNDRGLEHVPEAADEPERGSALQQLPAELSSAPQDAVSEPGRLVFVCRKAPPAPAAPYSDQAKFEMQSSNRI